MALRSVVEQTILPELVRRKAAADARRRAVEKVRDGEVPLSAARPGWDRPALQDLDVLDALLRQLDRTGAEREQDRAASLPDMGSRRTAARLAAAWTAALDAEQAADETDRRLLLALRGWLVARPDWQASTQQAARAPLEAAWAAARDAASSATEADRAAALDRLAALDAARARWDALGAWGRWKAVAPSVAPPDPSPELTALTTDAPAPLAADALARLASIHAFLDGDVRDVATEAMRSWLDGPERARRQGAPETSGPAGVAEAEAALETAVARRAALEDRVGPAADLRRELADLEVEAAKAHVLAAREASAAEARAARDAAAAADAARRTAELAAQAADGHPAVALRAESTAWYAAARAEVAALDQELEEAAATRRDTIAALTKAASAAVDPDAVDPVEAAELPGADATYARLRALMDTLRAQVLVGPVDPGPRLEAVPRQLPEEDRLALLDRWEREAMAQPATEERAAFQALLAEARAAVLAEPGALKAAEDVVDAAFEEVLIDLRRVTSLRHTLRPHVSTEARRTDRRRYVQDVVIEVRLLSQEIQALVMQRLRGIATVPALVFDLEWVIATLRAGLTTILWLLGWLVLRRRSPSVVEWVFDRVDQEDGTLEAPARTVLHAPGDATLRHLVDLVGAGGVVWFAALTPEVRLLAGGLAWASLFAALRSSTRLWMALPGEERPHVVVASEAGVQLVHRTWRIIGAWWVTGWVLDTALGELFYVDALAASARFVMWGVGGVLLLWILSSWDRALHRRVGRMRRLPDWMDTWVSRERMGLLTPVRAVVLGGFLGAAVVWDVAQGRAAQQGGYSALASVMDRYRFGGEAEAVIHESGSLPPEVTKKLLRGPLDSEVALPRQAAEEALVGHVDAWLHERRRGVVVLTGDHGDGKAVFLERVAPMLRVDGRAPRRVALGSRITTEAGAIAWFADHFEIESVPEDAEELVDAINERPGRVHVVRQFQRAFLREVGGFDALRVFLYVCNATSAHHVWILAIHRPAWTYLVRLGALVNTGVVRGVVDMTPLGGAEVRELVIRRTTAAGLEVDFRLLEDSGPFGGPVEVERERATASYFRLLADASGGVPEAAMHLWSKSLRPRGDGLADVVVPSELNAGAATGFDDEELFVLAAIRLQDELTVAELGRVLRGLSEDAPDVVRELLHRGVLEETEHGVRIDLLWTRPVTRTLRRRHVLQWTV